ncbi:MAG: histidine kinase [Anaerolinea sp.]|nr:histidine kinase [Anaerolinea sp.]
MATVKQLLKSKGTIVWSVSPGTKTLDALKLMAEKDIGALLVMDGEKLVGIISERDFARRMAKFGGCDLNQLVQEVMITNVFSKSPEATMGECMKLMTDKHIRHLPIMEKDKVVGMITIGDIVKEIIDTQESTIRSLENFITGQSFEL